MIFVPRPCQDDLIADVASVYRRGIRRCVAVASTGFGKTVVFVVIVQRAAAKGKRVVIVAHRVEIVRQISEALARMGVRHGRIQPGHTMTGDAIQVGMVQTVARRLDAIPEPDLLVVDEAHHAVAGTWAKLAEAWQRCRILGVTATPERTDGRGLGEAFDAMVEAIPMAELIRLGFLAGYDYLAPPQQADLSGIGTRMGDYKLDDLAAAMDKAVITGDAVSHYRTHLQGRPAIAFCVSIAHAEHVAAQFAAAGFRAASVDGTMDPVIRRDRIAAIGDGRLNVLTACDIISEGTDIPAVSGAILLRPTKSTGMFLQQVGRVLRPKPDGSRAVILDHVGNVHRHGMPDMPREWTLEGRKKRAPSTVPTKTCNACFRVFPAGQRGEPCEDEPGCVFAERDSAVRPGLDVVDGALETMTEDRLAEAVVGKLRLTGHESFAELRQIAKARGYQPYWAIKLIQGRAKRLVGA